VYEVKVQTTNVLRTHWESADGEYRDCVDGVAYVATDTPIALARFLGDSWTNARRLGQVLVLTQDKEESHANP
jgi:hypothetical protein